MRPRLTSWLILSVVIGIASYGTTRQFGLRAIEVGLGGSSLMNWWWQWHWALEYISLGLSALWVAVFIVGSFVHGSRGLWLLIGAPLALPEARAALRELLVIAVFLFTGDAF
jgi:hypothetical protein